MNIFVWQSSTWPCIVRSSAYPLYSCADDFHKCLIYCLSTFCWIKKKIWWKEPNLCNRCGNPTPDFIWFALYFASFSDMRDSLHEICAAKRCSTVEDPSTCITLFFALRMKKMRYSAARGQPFTRVVFCLLKAKITVSQTRWEKYTPILLHTVAHNLPLQISEYEDINTQSEPVLLQPTFGCCCCCCENQKSRTKKKIVNINKTIGQKKHRRQRCLLRVRCWEWWHRTSLQVENEKHICFFRGTQKKPVHLAFSFIPFFFATAHSTFLCLQHFHALFVYIVYS